MTFGDHLEELRSRLIRGLLGFVVAAIVCMALGEHVVRAFCRPLIIALERNHLNPQLYYNNVSDTFMVYMQISLICAAAIASPWMVYQLWQFVAAGLYPHERKYVTKYLPLSITLLVTGMLFLYFFVLPITLEFFLNFSVGNPGQFLTPTSPTTQVADDVRTIPSVHGDPAHPLLNQMWIDDTSGRLKIYLGDNRIRVIPFGSETLTFPMITLPNYMDMVVGMLLSFGLAFQMPLVVLAVARIGIVDIPALKSFRKYVYFGMSILAACIVPDVVTGMIALLIPLIFLYEFGILLAIMSERKAKTVEHSSN